MYASSLIEVVRCHLGAAGARAGAGVSLREVLDGPAHRSAQAARDPALAVVAGVGAGRGGGVRVLQLRWRSPGRRRAGIRRCWPRTGRRRNPVTGAHEPPSASTLGRLPALLDADELEAGCRAWLAAGGAGPAARGADRRARRGGQGRRRGRSGAASRRPRDALREIRADGQVRAAPGHPWLDPGRHRRPGSPPGPARRSGVDGKERKLAKAGGKKKVHLLGAVTHVTGVVIGQDKVAKAGKANEITHFRPLLEPLPLAGVLITADAMQTQREHARWLIDDKDAHYLVPVLGNQPGLRRAGRPALGEHPGRGRHHRDQPRPDRDPHHPRPARPRRPGLPARPPGHPDRALRHDQEERPLGHAQLRGRAVRHQPGRRPGQPRRPARLRPRTLAVEHLHWLRDVIWRRGQIHHPHRQRPPGDVRPHQPRHHPVPATRSNQDHGGDAPQRPEPPPATPATSPPARLNTPQRL